MRSPRLLLAAVLSAALTTSCMGRGVPVTSGSPTPSNPRLETVELSAGDRTVTAEVADDHIERVLGLMHRRELGRDEGMLFLFPAATSGGGFWMKNTLIPLQIAYMVRGQGGFEVLSILEMVPCTKDPCPQYKPGVQYDSALEMNEGWFDAAAVEVGDVIEGPADL